MSRDKAGRMDQIAKLLARDDEVLQQGRLGLLCNQTSWSLDTGEYLYQSLARRGVLKRIFAPEHGLFGELQDQIALDDTGIYGELPGDVDVVSLYGSSEDSLNMRPEHYADLDALVIDIQDVGSRYYTFATTAAYIFDSLAAAESRLPVYVVDRWNPAGRGVEGTILPPEFASFVGRPGLIHRHGLTIGELCGLYREQSGGDFPLHVIRLDVDEQNRIQPGEAAYQARADIVFPVAPSPNMPVISTALVYSGQCLLEGTNLSEGRGTTQPFEIFGAPYLDVFREGPGPDEFPGCRLRPLRFIPAFHKYAGESCEGWRIHVVSPEFHALAFTLRMIRHVRETRPHDFRYRRGIYEFRSDRPAIEILVGDSDLLAYLDGRTSLDLVREKLTEAEDDWIRRANSYLLYADPLRGGRA